MHEPIKRQALISELPVEGLDIGIICGCAGLGEIQSDVIFIGPAAHLF
jgi:hypothetical protein